MMRFGRLPCYFVMLSAAAFQSVNAPNRIAVLGTVTLYNDEVFI